MKLLIITQKVNKDDPILGFFHRWIIEFAKNVELLTVVCLEEGVHDMPTNVRVLSLGKEKGVSKLGQLLNLYRYVWCYRNEYTHVFVHMNPIYVVLCWKLWFVLRKKVFLWYTHKQVDWKLRMASWFVRSIFTASEESLRLKTKKKVVTGHGIDTDLFSPDVSVQRSPDTLLSVGRITKTKRIDLLLDTMVFLPDMKMLIAGTPVTPEDFLYYEWCQLYAEKKGIHERVVWLGSVPHGNTRNLYAHATMFIHTSETGSLDKVLLEAAACGTSIISTSNIPLAMPGIQYVAPDPKIISDAILHAHAQESDGQNLQEVFIRTHHSLELLIKKLCAMMQTHK